MGATRRALVLSIAAAGLWPAGPARAQRKLEQFDIWFPAEIGPYRLDSYERHPQASKGERFAYRADDSSVFAVQVYAGGRTDLRDSAWSEPVQQEMDLEIDAVGRSWLARRIAGPTTIERPQPSSVVYGSYQGKTLEFRQVVLMVRNPTFMMRELIAMTVFRGRYVKVRHTAAASLSDDGFRIAVDAVVGRLVSAPVQKR
jgi:hypothetical protein